MIVVLDFGLYIFDSCQPLPGIELIYYVKKYHITGGFY